MSQILWPEGKIACQLDVGALNNLIYFIITVNCFKSTKMQKRGEWKKLLKQQTMKRLDSTYTADSVPSSDDSFQSSEDEQYLADSDQTSSCSGYQQTQESGKNMCALRVIVLFNRNLPTRCHKTSLGAFVSCIAGMALRDECMVSRTYCTVSRYRPARYEVTDM